MKKAKQTKLIRQRSISALHHRALGLSGKSGIKWKAVFSATLQIHRVLNLPPTAMFVTVSWKAGNTKGVTTRALVKEATCSWDMDEISFEPVLLKDDAGNFSPKELVLKVKEVVKKDSTKAMGTVKIDLSKWAPSAGPEGKAFPLTEVVRANKKSERKEVVKIQATLMMTLKDLVPEKKLKTKPARSSSSSQLPTIPLPGREDEEIIVNRPNRSISRSATNLNERAGSLLGLNEGLKSPFRQETRLARTSSLNASSLAQELAMNSQMAEEDSTESDSSSYHRSRRGSRRVSRSAKDISSDEDDDDDDDDDDGSLEDDSPSKRELAALQKAKRKIKEQEAMMAKLQGDLVVKKREEDETFLISNVIYLMDPTYSQGIPVAAFLLFQTLLHWKAFAPQDRSFNKVVDAVESLATKHARDEKKLYYWCSVTNTMLHMFRERFFSAGVVSPRTIAQSGGVHDTIERRFNALLFRFYLALLKCHYEALDKVVIPAILMQNTLGGPKRTDLTAKDLTKVLAGIVADCKEYHIAEEISTQMVRQLLYYINCVLFNSLLTREEFCRCTNGIQMKMGITELEEWTNQNNFGNLKSQFIHIRQASDVLTMQKSTLTSEKSRQDVCPNLKVSQLHALLLNYKPDDFDPEPLHPGVLKSLMLSGNRREDSLGALDPSDINPLDTNFEGPAMPDPRKMEIPITILKREGFGFLSSLQTEGEKTIEAVSLGRRDERW